MKCSASEATVRIATHAFSGEAISIEGTELIDVVDTLIEPVGDLPLAAPGFIDLQVNGFAGCDYNDPASPPESIARSIRSMYATGVTRLLPTLITGSQERIVDALRNLADTKETFPEGASMEGFHVEGPHISPIDGPRGAHPREHVRPPDIEEYKRWQEAARGLVRLVTLSPEWPEAIRYIEHLVRDGIVVSIGHTRATAEQIDKAVCAGASLSTHLGNGAHAVLPRHPNYIWEQLAEDRLAASFIVDGIHLPASFLRVALRAKGIERSILVTDAVMPAGCPPGPYKLGEVNVEMHDDGSVRLAGGTRLAGSALKMDRGVENLIRLGNVSLAEALTMAARNPARVARITGRQRGIAPGERFDLVVFRFDRELKTITVDETIVGGTSVYKAA